MSQLWIRTAKVIDLKPNQPSTNYLSIKPKTTIATMHCYMMAFYSNNYDSK